jgi:hypothetical protein
MTGYEVTNLTDTLTKAKASDVDVLVYRGALRAKIAAPVGAGPDHFHWVRDDCLFLVESVSLPQRI